MRKLSSFTVLFLTALKGMCVFAQAPMSLPEMFARADSVNASIQAFRLGVEAAQAAEMSARNAYLPSVDASLSLSYNGDGYIMERDFTGGFKAEIPFFGNNFKLEASQVIFAGGAISHGVALAELGTQMASFEAAKNRNEVRFLIAGDYIQMRKLDNQLRVLDGNLTLTRQLIGKMQVRVENGAALQTEVNRLELLAENLEYTRVQLESAREIVGKELANALGLGAGIPVVSDDLPEFTPDADWVSEALANAPAILISDALVRMGEHKEKIAQAERLPKISLFAGEYMDGPILIEIPPINKNFNYWAVGVGVRYNLAGLYKGPRTIRQARVATEQARAQLQVTREKISLAIGAAESDYRNAFRLLDTKTKSVSLAQENYDQVRYRYEEGLATLESLLDASNQLLDAQMQEVNARMSIAYNRYKLEYLAGII